MNYSRTALSDVALIQQLKKSVSQDRINTAALLADLAEVDARRLYLPAGYSSMFAYCIGELGLAEDSACKRIRAARTAREFPAIFTAVAEGNLSLSAVVQLAPHLTSGNAEALLDAALAKSKSEIEMLIAQRFPRSESFPVVESLPATRLSPDASKSAFGELSAPGRIQVSGLSSKVAPIAAERYGLRVVLSQSAHDLLSQAQSLLSHQIPSGDLSAVFERVLEIAVKQLEKQKFAATDRPRRMPPAASDNPRYIPRHVKRAVWRRDGGRCTFISSDGHRCGERSRLEFDHDVPVARGGQATVSGIRLRCRAHNLYAAECAFGADWMRGKREEARAAAATRKQAAAEKAKASDSAKALAVQAVEEVIPYLRALRIPARDARLAAEKCTSIPSAPLEERVRLALSSFGPRKTFTRLGNTAFAP